MNYQQHTGEAYIKLCYYSHGIYKWKKSKAVRTGIQGAIKNAKVKEIEEVILISKEDYYK